MNPPILDRFLHLKYYFSPLPDPNFQFTKATLALGLLVILAGIAFGIYRKKYMKDEAARKILKPYPSKLVTYGVLVLLLQGFREGGIPYLSMRIWFFVLLAFFLYTFIRLPFIYKREYARRVDRVKKNSSGDKYLPKKKH